jgi:hypothetical protein
MKLLSLRFLTEFVISGVFSSGLIAFNAEELAKFERPLNGPDPEAREATITEFSLQIAKGLSPGGHPTVGRHGNEVLPVLARALQDPNERVRREAVAALAKIAIATQRVKAPPKPGVPDITSYAPLRAILLAKVLDSDAQVRTNAIRSYMLTYPRTADVEQLLIDRFSEEPSEEAKMLTIDAIAIDSAPSERVTAFMLEQLKSDKYVYEVAKVSRFRKRPLPPDALPILAKRLAKSGSSGEREMLAQVIGGYGALAASYVPLLQEMVRKETSPSVKQNIQRALDGLRLTTKDPFPQNRSSQARSSSNQSAPQIPPAIIAPALPASTETGVNSFSIFLWTAATCVLGIVLAIVVARVLRCREKTGEK